MNLGQAEALRGRLDRIPFRMTHQVLRRKQRSLHSPTNIPLAREVAGAVHGLIRSKLNNIPKPNEPHKSLGMVGKMQSKDDKFCPDIRLQKTRIWARAAVSSNFRVCDLARTTLDEQTGM